VAARISAAGEDDDDGLERGREAARHTVMTVYSLQRLLSRTGGDVADNGDSGGTTRDYIMMHDLVQEIDDH
jgi:hypothetical protein